MHAEDRREPATAEDLGPHAPDRLAGYGAVAAVYLLAAAATGTALHRRRADRAAAPATQWSDIALVALSTYKVSRLLSKQTVTSPLRAPFAEFVGHAGPGEVNVRPIGHGWRRSVGELLSCPFCLDVWIASAGTAALRLTPGPARMALSAFAAVGAADLLQFVHVSLEHQAER